MPTKGLLKAFDEYASKMQKYTPTHCSIQWDTEKAKLFYNPPLGNVRTLLWHISMLITVDVALIAASGFILISQFIGIGSKLLIVNVLVIILFGFLATFGCLVHGAIVLYGDGFVRGWNEINILDKKISFFGKRFYFEY
jgi:hypothetical protein